MFNLEHQTSIHEKLYNIDIMNNVVWFNISIGQCNLILAIDSYFYFILIATLWQK